jgi:hypothetical protein
VGELAPGLAARRDAWSNTAMGLFFDQDWFDDRLRATGLTRASLAAAAGMTIDEVEMVFRDQRELEAVEAHAFARILAADPGEVLTRSGATPASLNGWSAPSSGGGQVNGAARSRPELLMTREAVAGLHERMDRLERLLELVLERLDRPR